MASSLPSYERIRELLEYNPATGIFRWRIGRSGASAGAAAGSVNRRGYIYIRVDRRLIPAHRLAWALFYGAWPSSDIDHRDANKQNNRITNLREATMSQNIANSALSKNNTSGRKGVTWDAARGLWRAQLTAMGKNLFLGRYGSVADAAAAYDAKAIEVFGDFARAA